MEWLKEDEELLAELYKTNSASTIAKIMGRSVKAVTNKISRMALSKTANTATDADLLVAANNKIQAKYPHLELLSYSGASAKAIVFSNQCGHKWEVVPCNIYGRSFGHTCPTCSGNTNRKYTDEIINSKILKYPGVSGIIYQSAREPIQIQYACGHTDSCSSLDNFLNKGVKSICRTCNPVNTSKGETELSNWLSNVVGIYNNTRVLDGLEIDIFIPSLNLGIEYNGEYWHSDVHKDKYYHINKTKLAASKGITLLHIFEHEWLYKQEIVKSRLLSNLSMNYKLGARHCKILEIPNNPSFLFNNHIQGAGSTAKYTLGLFLEDLLVAVMTFGTPRFNNDYEYELLRYCSLTGVNVIGGPSKLLKYFINTYKPNSIISYSDKRWSTGNLYKQLKFEYLHTSAPSYFYYKNKEIISRYKAQKHKLKTLLPQYYDDILTEEQIMSKANYHRVYDCGTDVWVLSHKSINGIA